MARCFGVGFAEFTCLKDLNKASTGAFNEKGKYMPRQFWQNKHNGDIWAVELDEGGHVLDSTGPLYSSIGPLYSEDFTEDNVPSFESLDSDWLEEHRNEFVLYEDEEDM